MPVEDAGHLVDTPQVLIAVLACFLVAIRILIDFYYSRICRHF
jgi:hypothetical protein